MRKKKLLLALGLSAALITPSLTVSAAEQEAESGGLDLDAVNGPVRAAKIDYVGGGKWNHYITTFTVFSRYEHNSKTHRASVKNSYRSKNSGWVPKFLPAEASDNATLTGNGVYWATR